MKRDSGLRRPALDVETAGAGSLVPRSERGLLGQVLVARPVLATLTCLAVGVGVLTASSWLSVPFYPVPLTMQTLAVLLIGGLLGSRLGVATVASYLALGLAGAPVFHGGTGGLAVALGPDGGYLLGFLPAAFLMGWVASRARAPRLLRRGLFAELVALSAGALLAEAAIYALGVPWLAFAYLRGSLSHAAAVGLLPFLIGDLLKAAVAIGAIRIGTGRLGIRKSLPLG